MRLFVLVLLFWFGNSKTVEAVVYGDFAQPGEFPSVVAIWPTVKDPNGTVYHGACAGSIISNEWILTAAHCVAHEGFKGNITTGIYRLPEWYESELTPQPIEIERAFLHQNYSGIGINDIALVKLSRKLVWTPEVQPIVLAKTDIVPSGSAVQGQIAGWASDADPNLASDQYQYPQLQKANVTIFAYDMCQLLRNIDYHKGFTECGIGQSASGCGGDSGTPLLVDGVQVGVLSGGAGSCDEPYAFIYVPVRNYIDWIQHHCGGCYSAEVDKVPNSVVLAQDPLVRNSSSSSFSVAVVDKSLEVVCAGTVIDDRWILTTATCVQRHQVAFIKPWGTYGGQVKIKGSHVFQDFQLGKPLHDIGLLELEIGKGSWMEKTEKVRLDTRFLKPHSTATHSGWSRILLTSDMKAVVPSETLVHVIFDEVCRKHHRSPSDFEAASMFCGIELLEPGMYIAWDSEGTCVIQDGVVVGVKVGLAEPGKTSVVHGSSLPNGSPTTFTRITEEYAQWIDGHCDCLEYLRPEPWNVWGWNGIAQHTIACAYAWYDRKKHLQDLHTCLRYAKFGIKVSMGWIVAVALWGLSKLRRCARSVRGN